MELMVPKLSRVELKEVSGRTKRNMPCSITGMRYDQTLRPLQREFVGHNPSQRDALECWTARNSINHPSRAPLSRPHPRPTNCGGKPALNPDPVTHYWLTTKPLFLETICWLQGFCSNPMEAKMADRLAG
ncbi:hypothetical protein NQZ68_021780 [Dissostichus eleginoides]|nr:hypothetical protein NQZ68_021780 [Dissostichus eleginoides]